MQRRKHVIGIILFVLSSLFWANLAQAQTLSKADVKQLQVNLNALGYAVGRPDGVAGKRTKAAIRGLSKDHAGAEQDEATADILNLAQNVLNSRTVFATDMVKDKSFKFLKKGETVDYREHEIPCDPKKRCEPLDLLVAAVDLNGDGLRDLVYATYYWINGRYTRADKPVIFLINDGNGKFYQDDLELDIRAQHIRDALVEDFNGDGIEDLFLLDHGMDAKPFPGGQNILLLSTGKGLVNATATSLPKRKDFSHGGAAGDLDGDGDLDILVITNISDVVRHNSYVLENDGNGKFKINDKPSYISQSLLDIRSRGRDYGLNNSATIADFDGDGFVDIAWLASGDDHKIAARKKGVRYTHITYNNGKNQYLSENSFDLPLKRWGYRTFVTDLHAVDMDGDGDKDIIATSNTRRGNQDWKGVFIDYLENRGGRTYVNVTHERLFPQGYRDIEKQAWNHWIYPVDLNLDGRMDLVAYSLDPVYKETNELDLTSFKVALQNEEGKLVPMHPQFITSSDYTMRRMMPVDIDNDGDADLIGSELFEPEHMVFTGFTQQLVENKSANK